VPVRRRKRRRSGRRALLAQYWMFRAAVGICSMLPLVVAMRRGEAVAWLLYVIDVRHRRVGMANLAIAFPDRSPRERRRILRGSWLGIGRTAVECCHMRRLTAETVGHWVTIDDPAAWQHIMATQGNSGALIVTGHFGNWELFAYASGLMGHPVHIVYRPLRNLFVDRFLDQVRRSAGSVTLRKSAGGTGLARALKSGALVVIANDQNSTRRTGVFVDLFGLPASTNSGVARLAMRTGMPVFPAFLVRDGWRARHRVVVGREIVLAETGDREADVVENTARFNRVLEQMIARYPDQWFWVHRRWKTRPPGEARFY
jgi:KDO2-lipid IV(A) lauroyltransferase